MAGFSGRAKAGVGVALVALAAGGAAWMGASQAPAPVAAVATPAASAPAAAGPRAGGKQHAPAVKPLEKPLWKDLTPVQQQALEPLNAEWDKMDALRKKKWLDIANRYASMNPDEQSRVHERMREWVKMTPEQRRQVRQNFARTQKIDPSSKSAQWEEYQQLPEEQKKELAAKAAIKKQVANLPTPAQSKMKTVEPIKRPLPPAGPELPAVVPGAAPAAGAAAASGAAASAASTAPASTPNATNVTPVPPAAPTNVK
jgi:hypothetical protein